jgi:hypothetical protein
LIEPAGRFSPVVIEENYDQRVFTQSGPAA